MSKERIEVIGLITDRNFHIAKLIAEALKERFPDDFLDPDIKPLFEFDWHDYLCKKKRELRGEMWEYSNNLICFANDKLLGNEEDFAKWANDVWNFVFTPPEESMAEFIEEFYEDFLHKTGHTFVYMDVIVKGETARLVFELFTDICPKTSNNFRALCTGEHGYSKSGIQLWYKNTVFHRIVPNGWVQGGDVSPGCKGNGGESIYGAVFEDESFAISHSKRGILGMANKGTHSNGSQFYITLQPALWMDRKYVAFGQVVEGVDTLKKLEEIQTFYERPKKDCKVVKCGVVLTSRFYVNPN